MQDATKPCCGKGVTHGARLQLRGIIQERREVLMMCSRKAQRSLAAAMAAASGHNMASTSHMTLACKCWMMGS